jgi:hypothetical protein
MTRWTIGLVGLVIGQGCATADTPDTSACSPFASGGQPGSAGDGDGDEGTGEGADDDTGTIDGGEATEGDEGTPTVGPLDTGDDDGGAVGDCCSAHEAGGCSDAMIEACVCGQDPVCCDEAWDEVCVESVAGFGCGECAGDPPPPPPGGDDGEMPPAGACCNPQAMPGCADATVEMCVCEADAYCCEMSWDEDCVAMVDELGCGDCGGAMPPADDGGGGNGDCCMPTGVPGCADPMIMDCVCGENEDVFCCVVEWDDICAAEVSEFGCGAC